MLNTEYLKLFIPATCEWTGYKSVLGKLGWYELCL